MNPVLTVEPWGDVTGLVHGFSARVLAGRRGGAEDPAPRIDRLCLAPVPIVVPHQVHGTRIVSVTALPWPRREADGLLAVAPGLAVGILTADCVPLLLLASRSHVGAAVHAGWRGALAGIVQGATRATAAAAATPVRELRVAVGPAIGACCYEVAPDVCSAFVDRYGKDLVAPAIIDRPPRPHLDLRRLVRGQLERAGVPSTAIEICGPCTACDPLYASYRRDGDGAGRQVSFIGWKDGFSSTL